MESLLKNITFPSRALFKKVELVAVYIEPRIDSGERICVGVVAVQEGQVKYAEVANLKKLRCLYGFAHTGLIHAAQIGLKSLSSHILTQGFERAVTHWTPPAQGLFLGNIVTTSSASLDDALRVSLSQSSSLYVEDLALIEEDYDSAEDDIGGTAAKGFRLERFVKETAVLLRPEFEKRFGQKRQIKDGARAMRLGYVGHKLVANFGSLNSKSISAMVSNSKAKLWDLATARDGTKDGWFDAEASQASFELFVYHSALDEPDASDKQRLDIAEAFEELETEADKVDVRCRRVESPIEIAKQLVAADS